MKNQSTMTDKVILRAQALAWAGKHTQAIETASHELGRHNLKPKMQMDLLDLRAESYIAIGKLDLAAADADAMTRLAKQGLSLSIQALNRKAIVQMRTGDLKSAVKSASAALKIAQKSKQKRCISQSLLILSESQTRKGQLEKSIVTAEKAIAIFQELNDLSGAGRAYWCISTACFDLFRAENSRKAAQTALELCQQAGDQYGIGNAYNAYTYTDTDIAERLQHLHQAKAAYETAGYVERQTVALVNLAVVYSELGLYTHNRRLNEEAIRITGTMGARLLFIYALGNIIDTEIKLGELQSAQRRIKEYVKLVPTLGDPTQETSLAQALGDIAFAEGNFKIAIQHYQSGLRISAQTNLGRENVFLTEIGKTHIASRDSATALKTTTKATNLHREQSYAKPDGFPTQAIWWRHVQALLANKKIKEAREALDRAYDLLLEGIQNIPDVGLRRNYLNKVALNRELLQYWLKDASKRKLSKERTCAYLNIESNPREPFKRLTNTSLRLNALHTVEEIKNFLVEEATELSGGERVVLILENDGKREAANSLLPHGEDARTFPASIGRYLTATRLTHTTQLILPKKQGLSRIIAPLITQNKLIGYIYVDMDSTYGVFNETDRDMIGMLANQAAIAIDNASLVIGLEQKINERTHQLQERIYELQIINSFQQNLAAEMDFQSIVSFVGDKLREVFNTSDLGINWYDEKSNLLHYLYAYEHGVRLNVPPQAPRPGGLFERMTRTRQPFILNNAADYKKMNVPAIPGTDQSKSSIAVPIISNDRVLGFIATENHQRENAFGESELRLLTTIAASLGSALENSRLLDETQRLLKESNTLADVGRDISSSLETKTVLENINSYASNLLKGSMSAIFIPEKDGDSFRAIAVVGHNAEELRNEVIASGEGVLGDIARNKSAEIVNNIDNDPRAVMITGTENVPDEHLLAVPLLADDELKGLMAVWRAGKNMSFTHNELTFLTNLARQAVIALKNSQLFTEMQEARATAEQADKAKSAFLANISHELRTPLNAIINFTELVAMGTMGPINIEQEEALGYSLSSSKHLLQLINDVLDISKIQAGKLTLFVENDVNLHVEIQDTLKMVEPLLHKHAELYGHDVKLIRDIDKGLPIIACDRRRIKQVLLNLLSNAVKFTQKGSITLSAKRHEDHIAFAVMDTGQGISQDQQKQIFEPFTQALEGTKHVEGTGLGLPITKSLIEAHGGSIWLESTPGEGTSFFFKIPTTIQAG
ncbi:MAG TPA: GAF domain-containing sensor histidine kinase [Anaerolineales bacterium]|nr:GAF domain-containing sensor histidine kinase [Anaerolineales bacterium]